MTAGTDPAEPTSATREATRTLAVARIALALIATWVALVAIPNAIPWTATDDAARALANGVTIASIIAVVGLSVAFVRSDSTGDAGARIGVSAAVIALLLAGLEVVNLMLIPADAPHRGTATGIGLILLLVAALMYLTTPSLGFFGGFKFSSLTLAGTVAAIVLVGVYLLLVQSMSTRTGSQTSDGEWTRLTSLLGGLQALAFAAAGALLGTAVQAQATTKASDDARAADAANDELADTVTDVVTKVKAGTLVPIKKRDAIPVVLETALAEDPATYLNNPGLRAMRVDGLHQSATASSEELTTQLERSLDTARRLRRRP